MTPFFRRAARRALVACAPIVGATLLAGCDGPGGAGATPIDLTVAATDATTPVDVAQPATVTFTVSNQTSRAVTSVNMLPSVGLGSHIRLTAISCTAQGGACPDTSGTLIPTFDMPAGARLSFALTYVEVGPTVGDQTASVDVGSYVRTGSLGSTAHLTAVDGRSGTYQAFAVSGLRTAVDVRFGAGNGTFSASSGGADRTLAASADDTYDTFPSGGHLASGPDILVGQADLGAGLDTFIAARRFVTALSDLDGRSFSAFHVVKGAAASASDAVSGTLGPLDVWQLTIAGATMTACADTLGALAHCDPARRRTYVLSEQGNGVFAAADSADNDAFTFQVARSGNSLVYLRADVAPSDALFAIGFADAAPLAAEHDAYGTVNGVFGVLGVTPTAWEFLDQKPTGEFGPASPMPIAAVGDSVPGLMAGTRAADGVQVLLLQQGALALTGTPTGEIAIAVDRPPY